MYIYMFNMELVIDNTYSPLCTAHDFVVRIVGYVWDVY